MSKRRQIRFSDTNLSDQSFFLIFFVSFGLYEKETYIMSILPPLRGHASVHLGPYFFLSYDFYNFFPL